MIQVKCFFVMNLTKNTMPVLELAKSTLVVKPKMVYNFEIILILDFNYWHFFVVVKFRLLKILICEKGT